MLDNFAPLNVSSQNLTDYEVEKLEYTIIFPVPDDAPPPDFIHYKHGEPSLIHAYRDEDGRLNGYTCRFDFTDDHGKKDKDVIPYSYCKNNITGSNKWIWKGLPAPRPLYGLEKLSSSPEATIVIAEGEKIVDALSILLPSYVSLTSSGGSKSAAQSNWSFVKNKTVIIWPDKDNAGQLYANDVQRLAFEAGATTVQIMSIPDTFPEKWDAADALAEGWTSAQTESFVDETLNSKQYKAINLQDFLNKNILPREMILSPIIPQKGLTMLHAVRGIGKTHVALNIAYSVATGGIFLKWSAPKPRKVLLIDGEMPEITLQERLRGITGGNYDKISDGYFKILAQDAQEYSLPSLHTLEGQTAINEHLNEVELVILDNISTLCGGGGEDKADNWQPIQDWLLDLRRKGISVLLIHHSGKTGKQRGTSRREDVLDTVITLRKPDDYCPSDGARFEVHYEKARGFSGRDAEPFETTLTTVANKTVWEIKPIQDSDESLKKLVEQGFSMRQIAAQTGIPKSTVSRKVKQ